MELIRIYNPDGGNGGRIEVRKEIVPDTIVTYEEHFSIPDHCNVVANNEIFIVDITFDELREKIKNARLM